MVNSSQICNKINKAAHKDNGILALLENEKNNKNPDTGNRIKINSEGFKKGLSGKFIIRANKKTIDLINAEAPNFPKVEEFIRKISDPISAGF